MSSLDRFYEYPNNKFKGSYCFTEDDLTRLINVIKDNFPKRETNTKFSVTLKSGLTFSRRSLQEIIEKETNSGENFITTLRIDVSFGDYFNDGYKSVSVDIDTSREYSVISLKVVAEDRNWVMNVAQVIKERIDLANTHYGFLYNFSLMLVLIIILGSIINASKDYFLPENIIYDFLFSFFCFPILMFFSKYLGIWLFPRMVIAIGQEKKNQQNRDSFKRNFKWSVLVGVAISLVFYLLP